MRGESDEKTDPQSLAENVISEESIRRDPLVAISMARRIVETAREAEETADDADDQLADAVSLLEDAETKQEAVAAKKVREAIDVER